MSADFITDELVAALDESHDSQYESYLAAIEAEPPAEGVFEQGNHLFQIFDRSSADWALRKILKAKRNLAEAEASHDEQVRAVMAKVERLLEPIRTNLVEITNEEQRTIDFFESLLITYHRKLIAEDPKATSVKLAFGKLTSRKGQDKYEFAPEFIEWAKDNAPELLRVKHEVAVAEAKKAIGVLFSENDGQMIVVEGQVAPGVTWTPGERSFSVDVQS